MKIASAPTIERLTKLINEFYYSTTYSITEDLKIFNSKGKFEAGKVEKKANKYIYSTNQN
jgi:hypothetical protein